jgi:hypothetical protein
MKLCVSDSIIRFFEDDTRILKRIHTEQDVSTLQQDLNNVIAWARQNNMAFHEDKFEHFVHKETLTTLCTSYPLCASHKHTVFQMENSSHSRQS